MLSDEHVDDREEDEEGEDDVKPDNRPEDALPGEGLTSPLLRAFFFDLWQIAREMFHALVF